MNSASLYFPMFSVPALSLRVFIDEMSIFLVGWDRTYFGQKARSKFYSSLKAVGLLTSMKTKFKFFKSLFLLFYSAGCLVAYWHVTLCSLIWKVSIVSRPHGAGWYPGELAGLDDRALLLIALCNGDIGAFDCPTRHLYSISRPDSYGFPVKWVLVDVMLLSKVLGWAACTLPLESNRLNSFLVFFWLLNLVGDGSPGLLQNVCGPCALPDSRVCHLKSRAWKAGMASDVQVDLLDLRFNVVFGCLCSSTMSK